MTFDEATESINVLSAFSTVYGISPTVVRDIISKLKEEYAPTIKMTQKQYNGLVFEGKGRETVHKNFAFMQEVNKYNDEAVNIQQLMGAFSHPETIEVVE